MFLKKIVLLKRGDFKINQILEFDGVVRSPHFRDFNFRAHRLPVDVNVKLSAPCHDKKDDEMI